MRQIRAEFASAGAELTLGNERQIRAPDQDYRNVNFPIKVSS
ncbi:hypothetical protein D516_1593 [Rhodobacter sp. AKP1]|nr:Hypothetical Protein RSKD131_3708 [Cereibacter sphaeroides KD131]EKX57343.1 hypothetical protein D516_1593 [Rhodobacter sp. AKP1]